MPISTHKIFPIAERLFNYINTNWKSFEQTLEAIEKRARYIRRYHIIKIIYV